MDDCLQNTTRADGIGSGDDSHRKYTPRTCAEPEIKRSRKDASTLLAVANGDETGTSLQVRQGSSKYFPGQNGDSDFRSGKKKARCFRIGLYLSC